MRAKVIFSPFLDPRDSLKDKKLQQFRVIHLIEFI